MTQENLLNYHQHQMKFHEQSFQWRYQPLMKRSFTDRRFGYFFCFMFMVFVVLGLYYILDKCEKSSDPPTSTNYTTQDIIVYFAKKIKYGGISFGITLAYMMLNILWGKFMIRSIIVITIAGIIAGGVFAAIYNIVSLTVVAVTLAAFVAYGFMKIFPKLQKGIKVLKVTRIFIKNNLINLLLMSILFLFVFLVLIIFWFLGGSGIILCLTENQQDPSGPRVNVVVWVLIFIFFTFNTYYTLTFLTASQCFLWYYNKRRSYSYDCCNCCDCWSQLNWIKLSYKWCFKHIGSLTLASLMVPNIMFLSLFIQEKQKANKCTDCLTFMLSCFVKKIKYLIKVFDKNSIIMMALTGKSMEESSNLAIGLLSSSLDFLQSINTYTTLINMWGLVGCVAIPIIIFLFEVSKTPDTKYGSQMQITIVFLFSLYFSVVTFGLLVHSISSVYITCCLDRKFQEFNYNRKYKNESIKTVTAYGGFENMPDDAEITQNFDQDRIRNLFQKRQDKQQTKTRQVNINSSLVEPE